MPKHVNFWRSDVPLDDKKVSPKVSPNPRNDHGPLSGPFCKSFHMNHLQKVGVTGFEPATSWSRNSLRRNQWLRHPSVKHGAGST